MLVISHKTRQQKCIAAELSLLLVVVAVVARVAHRESLRNAEWP